MKTVAFVVGVSVLLLGVVIAARLGIHYLSDPPSLEVKLIRGGDLGKPIAEASDRSHSPSATLATSVRTDRFVVRGYVEPRHNDSSKLWVNIVCFNKRGIAQAQETFFDGVSNGHGGRSTTLDVRVDNAGRCLVNARAGPQTYVSVLSPMEALARVSIYCPTGCLHG